MLLLSGCGKKISSEEWAKTMIEDRDVDKLTSKVPGLYYCFNRDTAELREILADTIKGCTENIHAKMPDVVSASSLDTYTNKLTACLMVTYYDSNREYFQYRNLQVKERKECVEMMSDVVKLKQHKNVWQD